MAQSYHRKQWSHALFILPFLVAFVVLLVFPLFWGIWLSLHKVDLFGPGKFVGMKNYFTVLNDPIFLQAVRNTFVFVIFSVPALVGLGLFLAMALNRNTRASTFLRSLFFSSSVLSVTIVTLIWRFVFVPGDGLLPIFMNYLGMEQINFLSTKGWALFSIGVATVWWGVGLPMMLFLAALQQIPADLYEAAALDNASPWRVFSKITLPSITRTLVLVTIIQIVFQFQLFGQARLLTNGGPNGTSRPLVMYIYETGFKAWDIGKSAAASEILFMIILVAAMAQYVVSTRKKEA